MKATITIYRNGQISTQYDVVGFEKAVKSALVHMCSEIEMYIVRQAKDVKFESQYLMKDEWSCTLSVEGDEVYGLTVEKAV